MENIYNLYQKAVNAKRKADFWKAEADTAKKALQEAMEAAGVERLAYENAGTAFIVKASDTVMVDGDKVKAMFPDWAERFGKAKHTAAYVRFK